MGGIVGSVVGAISGSNASSAQADAANQASALQWKQYQQTRKDQAPWRTAGSQAVTELWNKVQAGPGDYKQSPGYLFQLAQGTGAMNASAAANGTLLSGQQQKSLNAYGQNYASSDYDNFLNRYYQSLTPYQSVAGLGQTATQATSQSGMNAANQMGANSLYAGQARASGYLMQNAATQSGINSLYSGGLGSLLSGVFSGSSGGSSNAMSGIATSASGYGGNGWS